MKKILIIAFACKPNAGSESGVGWNFSKLIQEFGDVYVLVRDAENQKELLSNNKELNVKYIFYDLPNCISKLQNKQVNNGQKYMELYYLAWQIGAIKHIIKNYGRNYFDIVHHITFVSATLPSYFILLKSKFIWGPISSNDLIPKGIASANTYIKLCIKDFMKKIIRTFSISFQLDKRKASYIIANTSDIFDKLKLKNEVRLVTIPSIGIEENEEVIVNKKININTRINIISIGEFLDIKNFDITVEAFNRYNSINPNSKLYLIGDGPNRKKLERLVVDLGLTDDVIFVGWISRNKVYEYLKNTAHVLLFPTCEKAGMVILEALQNNVPVVGMNFGGPKEFVTNNSGVLVEVKNREQIVDDLAIGINNIVNNYSYYLNGCKEAIVNYYWTSKRNKLKNIYDKL